MHDDTGAVALRLLVPHSRVRKEAPAGQILRDQAVGEVPAEAEPTPQLHVEESEQPELVQTTVPRRHPSNRLKRLSRMVLVGARCGKIARRVLWGAGEGDLPGLPTLQSPARPKAGLVLL